MADTADGAMADTADMVGMGDMAVEWEWAWGWDWVVSEVVFYLVPQWVGLGFASESQLGSGTGLCLCPVSVSLC